MRAGPPGLPSPDRLGEIDAQLCSGSLGRSPLPALGAGERVGVRGKPVEWASAPHPSPLPVNNGEGNRPSLRRCSSSHVINSRISLRSCGYEPLLRRLEVAERKQEREVVHDLEHAAEHERQAEERCREQRTRDGRADGGGKTAGNRCHACRCRAFGGRRRLPMTKDVRVGTSICENADRSSRKPKRDGQTRSERCRDETDARRDVSEHHRVHEPEAVSQASRHRTENAERTFDQKKNPLAAVSERSKRSNSHSASRDCTVNPPAKKSRLNRAASLYTVAQGTPRAAFLVVRTFVCSWHAAGMP